LHLVSSGDRNPVSSHKSSQRSFLVSFVEQSARSVRLIAVRCLPHRVKAALYPIRARVLGRGLARSRVFEPSVECRAASASMSIIVPIHDAPSVTRRCLESLERNATKSEIILVDDGSKLAETTELIRKLSSRNGWKVVQSEEPRGHSAACAAGARLASRPYLCLLNSDTVVTPWCWGAIQHVFDTDPLIGVAGPSTSSSGNQQTLDIASKCCLYWNDSQICAFAERLTVAPLQPGILDLPWISGFALFIRTNLWETLGGFDQNLKNYLNDVELCKRVTNLGYRTVWVRSAYIHHLGNQSHPKIASAAEVQSAMLPSLQYVRNKHKWEPCVNAGYTTIVRTRDGKTWALRSDRRAVSE
jgi:GT2 family glycosyltransferase